MRWLLILLLAFATLIVRIGQEVWANPMSAAKGGGHRVLYNGAPMPPQPDFNFTGAGITCSDVPPATVCTVSGAAGGAPSFLDITTGTNSGATMTCNTGCAITTINNGMIAATTAAALAANPATCPVGPPRQVVTDIADTGVLTCNQLDFADLSGAATDAQVPNNITITLAASATQAASVPTPCGAGLAAGGIGQNFNSLNCVDPIINLGTDPVGILPLANFTDNDTTANLCLLSGGAGGPPSYAVCPAGSALQVNGMTTDGGSLTDNSSITFGLNTATAPDTITASIANGAVGVTQLATDSVDVNKIAANAVGTSELIDGSVANADLGNICNAANGILFRNNANNANICAALPSACGNSTTSKLIFTVDSGFSCATDQTGTADINDVGTCSTGSCFQSGTAGQYFGIPTGGGPATMQAIADAHLPSTIARVTNANWFQPFGPSSQAETGFVPSDTCRCWRYPIPYGMTVVGAVGYDIATSDSNDVGNHALYLGNGSQRVYNGALDVSSTGTKISATTQGSPPATSPGEFLYCVGADDATQPSFTMARAGEGPMYGTQFDVSCPNGVMPTTVTVPGSGINISTFAPPSVWLVAVP